jgi:hypothetical protein
VFESGRRTPVSDVMLREALIVHGKRRLRRDATLSIAGSEFETTQSFLAGRNVTIGRSLLDCSELPWIEHEDQRHVLTHVAPRANAQERRPRVHRGIDAVPFDPPGVLLAQATGKLPKQVKS